MKKLGWVVGVMLLLALTGCVFLLVQYVLTPEAGTATLASTATPPIAATIYPSSHWSKSVSDAEARWQAGQISTYTLTGEMSWGWHAHSFQIVVRDGQIVEANCKLDYDVHHPSDWCETGFNPQGHLVPALLEKMKGFIQSNQEWAPEEDCIKANIAWEYGVPNWFLFDCRNAYDEENEWNITLTK